MLVLPLTYQIIKVHDQYHTSFLSKSMKKLEENNEANPEKEMLLKQVAGAMHFGQSIDILYCVRSLPTNVLGGVDSVSFIHRVSSLRLLFIQFHFTTGHFCAFEFYRGHDVPSAYPN
jgi:hypothetical protein